MNNKKFSNVLKFYFEHSSLKEKERTGWVKWNVSGRRESILEHISKAQALAIALHSEFDELKDINIDRVITMLAIHEEEARIGDITPYDGISEEEKSKKEREAIVSIFSPLKNGNYYISIFDEFEAKETKEAIFAYICDKFDPDLQAYEYSSNGRCSIQTATYEMVNHPKIQKIIKNGATTVFDVFWESDKSKYENTFLEEFFNYLRNF